MKKTKSRILIFATSFSLLTTSVALCQLESKSETEKIEKHVEDCRDQTFDIIAHRGFSSLALDNSQTAVTLCQKYHCVDGIEIDIRLTSDNTIILSHNGQITLENNQMFDISNSNYSAFQNKPLKNNTLKRNITSLKHLYNPYTGNLALQRKNTRNQQQEKITTLKEILNCYDKEKQLIIDVKYENDEDRFNQTLISLLKNYKDYNILLQSFDYSSLLKCKKELPNFNYQIIVNDNETLRQVQNNNIPFVALKYTLVNKEKIKQLLDSNCRISLWNINSYQTFNSVTSELGEYYDDVSYISNYPDCLCYWLQKKK